MWPLSSKSEHALSDLAQSRGKIIVNRPLAIVLSGFLLLGTAGLLAVEDSSKQVVPRLQVFNDPNGRFANLNLGGPTDTAANPFFQELGTNGRSCVTCHQPSDA
jgi:hypothetical protein